MLGEILLFNSETNEGKILGVDKQIYDFHIGEWLSNRRIDIGQKVIYDIEEDEARNIIIDKEISKEHILHLKIDVCLVE